MFLFKGKRKYLHSTDLISYVGNKYYNFKNLDIRFNKFIKMQPKIIEIKKKVINLKYNCTANFYLANKEHSLIFNETKKTIIGNYSYDENIYNLFFIMTKKAVYIKKKIDVIFIDIAVSMAKFFCKNKFGKKKWIVYRILLKQNIDNIDYKSFKVMLSNTIKNKIFIFEIIINNKNYGKIYYSFD